MITINGRYKIEMTMVFLENILFSRVCNTALVIKKDEFIFFQLINEINDSIMNMP